MSVAKCDGVDEIADSPAADAKEQQRVSREIFRRIVTSAEIAADSMASFAGVCGAYYLYHYLDVGRHAYYSRGAVAVLASIVALLIPLLLERDGAYRGGGSLLRIRETERIIRISWQTLLLVLPLMFFIGQSVPRGALAISIALLPLSLMLEKHLFFSVVRMFHAKGYGVQRVVIYGAGETGRRMLSALHHSPKLGLRPVAIVDDHAELAGRVIFELGYSRHRYLTIHHGPVTAALLASYRCELLVIAIPNLSRDKFPGTLQAALQAGADVAFLPSWAIGEDKLMDSIDIDGMLLTRVQSAPTKWHYRIAKRSFDICVSLMVLFILSPMLVVIALFVRLGSTGPILFKQERVGKNGRLFTMYKFRSMHNDSPKYEVSPREATDPRITPIGRFLRKTSLDEMPQLLNVLRGNMSLVGPRPEMPFIVNTYNPKQRQRLQVVPGITGVWQLSADRDLQIHENLEYDLYYMRNRSFFFDLALVAHTALFAMRGV